MKTIRYMLFCLLSVMTSAAFAEFSANVTLTSDYIWRGISQTLGDPAVQGGFDFEHDSGVYTGVWGSNVDFFDESDPEADPADNDEADLEIDVWLGFAGETGGGITWDAGVIGYLFPGADRDVLENNEEFYLALGYNVVTAQIYQDFSNDTTYLQAAVEVELAYDLNLSAHLGNFDFEEDPDYIDWRVALSREFVGLDFEIAYTDTDFSDDECEEFSGKRNLCDGTLLFSVSKEF